MRRFISVMFLTVVALFMLSAVTFAEGYSRPADCPYSGEGPRGSNDNRPMPLTGKNKGGKNGKNGKGKKSKGGKNGKNGKGKKGKGGKNGKNGKGNKGGNGGGNNNPKTPRAK